MLRVLKGLIGYTVVTKDGAAGRVKDFHFDDMNWTIRYLVADTGSWLSGRQVLLSPASLGTPKWADKTFPVELTKEQVENSPAVDADKPVSRQQEDQLATYYRWPAYWMHGHGGVASAYGTLQVPPQVIETARAERARATEEAEKGDPNLRSAIEVSGYRIEANDGELGHIDDYIFDNEDWSIRYMVVDTTSWWPGGRVLVSPRWVQEIRWSDNRVVLDMTKDEIRNSPPYDPNQPVNREYEARLYDYYGRPRYWS